MDDILGVIVFINWRSHLSGMMCYGMFGEKKVCFIIFSFQKSPTFSFQSNVLSLFFRSVSKAPANEKMERPLSTMSEASNYMGGSDNTTNAESPAGRVSPARNTLRKRRNHNRSMMYCVCSPRGLLKRFTTLGRGPTPLEGIPVPQ